MGQTGPEDVRFAIRVDDRYDRTSGFLGTAGRSHCVTGEPHARAFRTRAAAAAYLATLMADRHHFLGQPNRHFSAVVVEVTTRREAGGEIPTHGAAGPGHW